MAKENKTISVLAAKEVSRECTNKNIVVIVAKEKKTISVLAAIENCSKFEKLKENKECSG